MQSRFLRFLESCCALASCDGKPILLAVSGGVDSMVMLHLFLPNKISIKAAHCNFMLRKEAQEEEELTSDFCHRHDIPFFRKKFDTENFAKENKCSVQMAARELRYQWFEELLMNIVHAQGWEGMSGIKASRGNRIRPLLFASRKEIAEYALENKIQWKEDASNASLKYERNYVRHKIIPELKQLNPSLEKTF